MDFLTLAMACAPMVAPQTLEAIVKTESNYQPLAIGINADARLQRQPASKEEAIVTAKWLLENGYNIDVGLGQVNSSNFQKIGLSVEDAFDPCKNLQASAAIFHGNYQEARRQYQGDDALKAALSAYNTGTFDKGLTNGYVQKVMANMEFKEGTAESEVVPIPLREGAKRPAEAPKAQAQSDHQQPVKLAAQNTPAKDSDSVYSRTESEGEGNSIYVYSRTNQDVKVYQ